MPIYAEVITIGDEILYGQTLDTNSHWISGSLDEIGIKVRRKTTIGDTREEILSSFAEAENRADVVLITGGLGPTKDDLTKPLLTEYFNTHLVMNEEALAEITEMFTRRGKEITPINQKQAELPAIATKLTNRLGTAPGIWLEREGKIFISMPGVPFEMRTLMTEQVIPRLKERFQSQKLFHKIIRTVGIGESALSDMIEEWELALPPHIKLAYLPTLGMVKLRLTAIGTDLTQLETDCNAEVEKIKPLIAPHTYSYDDEELEEWVGKTLLEANKTIAFAESCTGGYLSHLITKIAGSSAYYQGSIVSYAYDVKEALLDVDADILNTKGAVSEEVVIQMAEAVRIKLNADIALAISGIAGPGGGTEEKPVGTVWIAYTDGKKTVAQQFRFTKDRVLNIQYSAYMALNMFRMNFEG